MAGFRVESGHFAIGPDGLFTDPTRSMLCARARLGRC